MQMLRETIQLLEQRMSQPAERESNLEIVLGNMWQALARSGGTDARLDSPTWRLVVRFARNIISTTQISPSIGFLQSDISTYPPTGNETFDASEWVDVINDIPVARTLKGHLSDSGYRTGF